MQARPKFILSLGVRRATLMSLGTVAATCAILTLVMQLWRADWTVPFAYSKDALLCAMLAKTVSENGWYLHNPLLGMPYGLAYYDYPFGDALHFALLWLLSRVTGSFGAIVNLFFVLSFPMASLSSLFALRRLGMTWGCAGVGALLYTFLPYHFLRGEPHLFLSMYWVVPLSILVMLWLGDARGLAGRQRWAGAAIVCALLGVSGFYYAFFAGFLFVVAGLEAAVRIRRARPLLVSLALVAIVGSVGFLNVLPNLRYWHGHGHNPQVAQRAPEEADFYGLKVAQLLLPVTGHRLPAQAQFKDGYNAAMPMINENDDSTLGVVGSMGFLALLLCLGLRGTALLPPLAGRLATLNLFAVLLGTTGGVGSLVALTVLPQIRSYNRVSIFIAFFALAAVLALVDQWRRQSAPDPARRRLGVATLAFLLIFGVFDQTSASFVPDYAGLSRQYGSDDRFVRAVEADVPPRSMVFQLPAVPFPESGSRGRMTDYQQFRGYLHSRTLRWSYGAMRGRAADAWQQGVAQRPLPAQVNQLARAGFGGIWVDRDGYRDGGKAVLQGLSGLLHTAPLASGDGRLLFFRLSPPPSASPRAARVALNSGETAYPQERKP